MLHAKFQTSGPSGSEKEYFEYISMHFYGSNLGPLVRGNLGSWGLHLNNLVKDHQAMLHIKFQVPEPCSSGEEDF